jgi:hypothetical protein
MNVVQGPPGVYHLQDMTAEEFAVLGTVMEQVKDEFVYAPCDDPNVHRMHTLVFMFWADLEVYRKESNNVRLGVRQALREGVVSHG